MYVIKHPTTGKYLEYDFAGYSWVESIEQANKFKSRIIAVAVADWLLEEELVEKEVEIIQL